MPPYSQYWMSPNSQYWISPVFPILDNRATPIWDNPGFPLLFPIKRTLYIDVPETRCIQDPPNISGGAAPKRIHQIYSPWTTSTNI